MQADINHSVSKMYILTPREELLCKEIVDCAYKVHKKIGPGLLERIYETCFCYELSKKGIRFKRQVALHLKYDEMTFDEGIRIDVIVEDLIICEIKAREEVNSVWMAQILSYLVMTDKHVGFVLNFKVPLIKDGIRRICKN